MTNISEEITIEILDKEELYGSIDVTKPLNIAIRLNNKTKKEYSLYGKSLFNKVIRLAFREVKNE